MNEHEKVQELLKNIFENVNNWLNFAEAKNAAMIAFDIALLAAVGSMKLFTSEKTWFIIHVLGTCISMILALASFLPNLGKEKRNDDGYLESDNLIFYKDIAKYDPKRYLKAVFKMYAEISITEEQIQKIELDYATEITFNSSVALRKYALFKWALWIQMLNIGVLILMAVI